MHSKYSDDGQYEPTELLKMCKAAGLDMMAIADHNSVRGKPDCTSPSAGIWNHLYTCN